MLHYGCDIINRKIVKGVIPFGCCSHVIHVSRSPCEAGNINNWFSPNLMFRIRVEELTVREVDIFWGKIKEPVW
jgi:hypothetical protein